MNVRPFLASLIILAACSPPPSPGDVSAYESTLIFPYQSQHVHGSTLVELPNGDFLAAWFQGSGERWADDVAIMGARRTTAGWSEPFTMADVSSFPDINPVLFIDQKERLWLTWYTVIANQWETSLLKYRISTNYQQAAGPPQWVWQDDLLVKPGGSTERGIQPDDPFVAEMTRQLDDYGAYLTAEGVLENPEMKDLYQARRDHMIDLAAGGNWVRRGHLYDDAGGYQDAQLGYPYFRRMGWQTRNKPFQYADGRIVLPLYSDGFSISLMAITDDFGDSWSFSTPLVGGGNIQPAIAQQRSGALVAFMRDNGPPPNRLHMSRSEDRGQTWSPVRDSEVFNPGSGADIATLPNGHWVLVANETEDGRHSLDVSLSEDEGASWPWHRRLEWDEPGPAAVRSHYPAIIVGTDGRLHVTYSFHQRGEEERKTIKYAAFTEEWIRAEDE